jgi:NADH-quinone oxidoreductase subunit F
MLKDKDRIFQNLYNDKGSDVESSQNRGDWMDTAEIIKKSSDKH